MCRRTVSGLLSGKLGSYKLGDYCFPILSTLVTGAARLILDLVSTGLRNCGGTYAFRDADSLAIAATENGGTIDQVGFFRTDIRVQSQCDAAEILSKFQKLNPYGDMASILEKESEIYTPSGNAQQLCVYSTARIRYALFNVDECNRVVVRKYSEHGLGAYRAPVDPITKQSVANWQRTLWEILITRELIGQLEMPPWAGQTALTSIRVSTHEHIKWFDQFNIDAKGKRVDYSEAVKPFNFMEHALITGTRLDQKLCLVAPKGSTSGYVNRYMPTDGRYIEHVDVKPKTYRDLILGYDMHPERKFSDRSGVSCKSNTRGLLFDQDVRAGKIVHIGKEGNSLEESRADLQSEPERQLEYGDSEYQDFLARIRAIPTKRLVELTRYNPRSIRRIKKGEMQPLDWKSRVLSPLDKDS